MTTIKTAKISKEAWTFLYTSLLVAESDLSDLKGHYPDLNRDAKELPLENKIKYLNEILNVVNPKD